MYDVIVIGAGMAGAVAALEARRCGAQVAVASRSWGATAMSTGALDVAYSPALSPAQQTPRTVAEHIMDIIAHRPRHPYGLLGLERTLEGVLAGHAVLAPALGAVGLPLGSLDLEADNVGLPSSLGVIMPAATAFDAHCCADLLAPGQGSWGIVEISGCPAFDGRRIAAGIARDAQRLGSGVALRVISAAIDAPGHPMLLARRLEDAAVLDRLVAAIAPELNGLTGIIVPPVLGIEQHQQTRARLSDKLAVKVIEALAHVPSVPGVRLQLALERALKAAGVDAFGEVVGPVVEGDRVRGVRLRDGQELTAGGFVLASGRFIAGGIAWGDRCREALFGLPVVTELGGLEADSPDPVVRERPEESHPLLTAGVLVGSDLRPVREGRVAYENLHAAGMVIGGFASRYALCADGVALASGALAARAAVQAAASRRAA